MAISRSALCAVMLLVGCGGREGGVGSGAGAGTASSTGVGSGASTSSVACADHPTTLVQPFWSQPNISEGQVGAVAVIGTNVYFTLYGPSSLWRVPVGGGQPTMLMSITGEEDAMVATPTSLVIAESSQGINAEIARLSTADGFLSTLAPTNGIVRSLVSDGVDVYFADDDGTKSVPIAGGSVRTLTSQKGTLGLAGANLLLADSNGGNVFSLSKTGGAMTIVATNQRGAVFPTSCGADLCWMNAYPCAGLPAGFACVAGNGEGAVVRMSSGGTPITLAQNKSFYLPSAMIFDNGEIFVVNTEDTSPDGKLSKVSASGGAPTTIGSADSIVVANGCLFAIDYGSGLYSVATSYIQ